MTETNNQQQSTAGEVAENISGAVVIVLLFLFGTWVFTGHLILDYLDKGRAYETVIECINAGQSPNVCETLIQNIRQRQ